MSLELWAYVRKIFENFSPIFEWSKLSDVNSIFSKIVSFKILSIVEKKIYIFAIELLYSISSFAGFEKRGVKVVSLHFAWLYFCILTPDFKVHRIPNSS